MVPTYSYFDVTFTSEYISQYALTRESSDLLHSPVFCRERMSDIMMGGYEWYDNSVVQVFVTHSLSPNNSTTLHCVK